MATPHSLSPSPTGRPSHAHPALLRRVHQQGVPVDVEGSDDEFAPDTYARSLPSSLLPSLHSKDSLAPTPDPRGSIDDVPASIHSDTFTLSRASPADVPTNAAASSSSRQSQHPFPGDIDPLTSDDDDDGDDVHNDIDTDVAVAVPTLAAAATVRTPSALMRTRRRRRPSRATPSSDSDADSFTSEGSAIIVNLHERPSPNSIHNTPQRPLIINARKLNSRPSTATSSNDAASMHRVGALGTGPHVRAATGPPSDLRSPLPELVADPPTPTPGPMPARGPARDRTQTAPPLHLNIVTQNDITAVNPPGTPSSVFRSSPLSLPTPTMAPPSAATPTAASPASFSSPLFHVLSTPLNLQNKPSPSTSSSFSAAAASNVNGYTAPAPPPPAASSRRYGETTRSASVSSSAGSMYSRGHGGPGGVPGTSAGGSTSGPSRSTSIGSGNESRNPSTAGHGPSMTSTSQSADNLHLSGTLATASFSKRMSGALSKARSAPPNPLDLRASTRLSSGGRNSGGGAGSASVENLHDAPQLGSSSSSSSSRLHAARERALLAGGGGSDARPEADTVPESPGASSARSSGSRFLSVGRKWPGYLHGNSSNESASSSAAQQQQQQTQTPNSPQAPLPPPVRSPGYRRTSSSARSDLGLEASTLSSSSGHPAHANSVSGASRPSTAGSYQVDAATLPRPSLMNGATWGSGGASDARSPERASFTTGWEKTSQRPPTVAPEMAPRALTEDDIEYEEAVHWAEPSSLFGLRRRLVAAVPDLGVKSSTFSRSRAKTMELPTMPQSSLLAEKDFRKMEERLEQRERDLSVEVLAEQETATVTLIVFTEQREAKWITKGPASIHALPMDHLPSMNDPWGVRIDAKGIVARKKLKSNIELVSTRTTLRCPECSAVRQTRMDVQCHLCRGVQAVEMVYVVLVTIRMANFTPLKLPASLVSGAKQPHFHYYEGDPAMRSAALQERAFDSALTAARRVGTQHYAQHGAKLLMVKARVDRRRVTSVAVLSTKTGRRRTFDLSEGPDGKVSETTPGRRGNPDDAASIRTAPGAAAAGAAGGGGGSSVDDASSRAGSFTDHAQLGGGNPSRLLPRKHSMPAVLKQGASSIFGRRGSVEESGVGAPGVLAERGGKARKKLFG